MWNDKLKTLGYFLYLFGPSFPKMTWFPNTLKQVKLNPQIGFIYTWVRLQLMWNVEFNKNQPSNGFYTWVRFQLMWNVEFNTLDDFLYIQALDLGYLGPISLT